MVIAKPFIDIDLASVFIGLLLSAALISSLSAQNIPPQMMTLDQQEQRERAQREAQAREQRIAVPEASDPDIGLPLEDSHTPYTRTDLPVEDPCFTINTIALQGEMVDQFAFVQRYLDTYTDRCIGQQGISLIVRRASDLLLAKGYVTSRIGLPEQNLASGKLSLLLVPGTIAQIRFADSDRSPPASLWKSAFPARSGDILNLRALEQGLEQLKRIPSQDVTMELVPGALPGQTDVVISLQKQKPWRGSASINDSGSKGTGKMQATASLWLDNALRRNDLLNVGINHDASQGKDKGTQGYNTFYSMPFGNWRIGFSAYGSKYHQTVEGAVRSFTSSGRSRNQEVSFERLLSRDQNSRSSAELRVSRRRAHSYVEGVEIDNQRRKTTSAELALLHRQYLGNAQMDLRLSHKRGLPWLGGDDDEPGAHPDSPTFKYGITALDLSYSTPIALGTKRLLWNSTFHYQWSPDPLYGSEYISIGGRYTVNGYDGEMTIAGAQGGYWRNSFTLPLHRAFAPYIGLDMGYVASYRSRGIQGGHLMGVYAGMRGDVAGELSWDGFIGHSINPPAYFKAHTDRTVAGFNLNYQF